MSKGVNKEIFSSGVWAFSVRILTVLVGLISNALLARLLVPEDFGSFFLVLSVASTSASISQLGLDRGVVRLISEANTLEQFGRTKQIIEKSLSIGGLSAFAVSIAFGLLGWSLCSRLMGFPIQGKIVLSGSLLIIFIAGQLLSAEMLRGFKDIRLATIFSGLCSNILSALFFCTALLLYKNITFDKAVLLSSGAFSITLFLSLTFIYRKYIMLDGNGGIKFGEVVNLSFPMWVTKTFQAILLHADLWIVGAFLSQQDVALYGASIRVVRFVIMPLLIVNAVVPPFITEFYVKGEKGKMQGMLRTVATIAGLPAFLVLLIYLSFGPTIMSIIFGEYYREAAIILYILSIGRLVNVWTGSCAFVMMMTGHQRELMVITLINGSISLIGCVIVAEPFGIVGVAAVCSLLVITLNITTLMAVKRFTGVWTHMYLNPKHLLKIPDYVKNFR